MTRPLEGIRVLDVSTVLAAPLVSALLAEFGAEVIKVEEPSRGDPARSFSPTLDGASLQWKVTNRGKKSVTLDLRRPEGVELLMKLCKGADVVITNFRPSTAERWGIDYESISRVNPAMVVLHLTAFGLTGPNADDPGFARVAEAFAGLTHITGDADGLPTFPGYPVADGIAGFYGAFLVMVALRNRDLTGSGELIDLGLYEPVLRLMEDFIVRYDVLGEVKNRQGNAQDHSCPNDVFPTADDQLIVLPASTPNMWDRLVSLIGDRSLENFDTTEKRVANRALVDGRIAKFTAEHDRDPLIGLLRSHGIACGPVNTAADICSDPQIAARNGLISVYDPELRREIRMQGPIGHFRSIKPTVDAPAPRLGQHNDEIFGELLRLGADQLASYREQGIL